jgi:WD40 repeat protein
VYLSCHGLLDARRRLYFAAADTRKDRLAATGVEAAWVLDQLEHCRARRQVLILDSCFSGAFAHGAKGEVDLGLRDRFLGQGRGRVVLTASTATEYSFEGDPTDAAVPAGPAVTSAPLPESLRTGLDSPHPGIRIGAVTELGEWLTSGDPARAAAARQRLQDVASSDIPRVAVTARALLDTKTAAQPPSLAPSALAPPPPPLSAHAPSAPVPPLHLARILTGHTGWVRSVVFSPDGLLATASTDKTARLWDPATGDCLRTLSGHTAGLRGVVFSADGRLLATASTDRTARLWDPATGGCLHILADRMALVCDVAFSPDGRLLATGSTDASVKVWDPATGECLHTLAGHSEPVYSVAFSADGRILATSSIDKTVNVWNWLEPTAQRAWQGPI